jgi:Ca2+-binding RTX toxin-like protein
MSQPATVTITVNPANRPPTVAVVAGGTCLDDDTGRVVLSVTDPDSAPAELSVSATSSREALLPSSRLRIDGSGSTRWLTADTVSGASGRATVRITVDDGALQSTTTVTVIVGTGRANQLAGTAGADLLLAKDGNDTVTGAQGRDVLCGGNGADVIRGGTGHDTASGGVGADRVSGDDGNDSLRGGSGADRLSGGAGADTLRGESGADFFSGGSGSDTYIDVRPAKGDTSDGT